MATKVLFSATDGTHGDELWITDGTTAGTHLVKDIDPGSGGSDPLYITALGNGTAIFAADDGSSGKELWITDGTTAGTTLLQDINPGAGASYPEHITLLGDGSDKAVFEASDGSHGFELWVTNGTAAGTYQLQDIEAGPVSSYPQEITPLGNGKALFSAENDAYGYELWVTDGTTAGTHLVKDIYPSFPNSNPQQITPLGNGKAVFQATDGTHGAQPHGDELWVTDGTAAGTMLVKDIYPGAVGSYPGGVNPGGMAALGNGKAVFQANDGTHGTELWVTDGTAAGTALVKDIDPGSGSSGPSDIIALGNGKAVFQADDGTHGTELWVTNGISTGTAGASTYLLMDINPGGVASDPTDITALGNGKALFQADDGGTYGNELWVTDGTTAGTMLVKDINPGAYNSTPFDITAIGGGQAMFQADDGTHGNELWVTDGTAAGTKLVDDIYPGADASNPVGFAVLQPACFCRGSRILTVRGEVAVEALAIGDLVVTLSGLAEPIRWIGRRAYDGRFIAGHPAILPICVAAGALADGVPARDLWLSPEHSLCLDGVLVRAEHLVNGMTIAQADRVERLEYFHIELDAHDVILADGAPAETYVDCDNRNMFQNAADFAEHYPGDERPRWRFCLPRLEWGESALSPIRAALFARAEALGHRLDPDPDLHLVVDGAVVPGDAVSDRIYRFTIQAGSAAVALASRSAVPARVTAASRDLRWLGVAVERLVLRDPDLSIEVRHGDAALCEGFHPDEGTHRWTDGLARLPEALLSRFPGAVCLEVHLVPGGLGYRPDAPGHTAAAA
jgi:ELWxxDGT repeat protein